MIYAEIKIVWKCLEFLRENPIKTINFKNQKWNYEQKSSWNHMKMQKSVISVKKNLEINIWKIKEYHKVRDHCHYTGEYRDFVHSKYNLK